MGVAVLALGAPMAAAGAQQASGSFQFHVRTVAANVSGAEPSVQVDHSAAVGIHVTTPNSGPTLVWSSSQENGPFTASGTGQLGGDTDMAVDGVGHLYEVEIYDSTVATTLPVSVSYDHGHSFRLLRRLAPPNNAGYDRPWITAWGNGHILVTATALASSVSQHRAVAWRSDDGGRSWTAEMTIGLGYLNGPPLHTPDGALYAASGGSGRGVLWRSRDQGRTWAGRVFVDAGADYLGWPKLAGDGGGHLYCVWEQEQLDPILGFVLTSEVFLARSDDAGQHWTRPLQLSAPGHSGVQPWPAAGRDGRIDVSYYQARQTLAGPDGGADFGTPTTVWDVELTQLTHADSARPEARTTTVASAVHQGSICVEGAECVGPQTFGVANVPGPLDRRFLDLFQIAVDPHGNAVIAFPHDRPLPANIVSSSIDILVAVQTAGPQL